LTDELRYSVQDESWSTVFKAYSPFSNAACSVITKLIQNNKTEFMKTKKLNFANIKNVLTREETKKIMAGSSGGGGSNWYYCPDPDHPGGAGKYCQSASGGNCC
jgi:hypothetical protein